MSLAVKPPMGLAFIEIYWVFPSLSIGIVAYAFTLFWTTFVAEQLYTVRVQDTHQPSYLQSYLTLLFAHLNTRKKLKQRRP